MDDVAPYIARSVQIPEAYNDVFNIGADTPYSVQCLADTVARAFGVPPTIRYLPARTEVANAYSDHSKARRVFGAITKVDLDQGVARMAAWSREVGARESKEFEAIEIERNLPAGWQK
jgi:UDP-glucose 4-epimerase